MLQKLVDKKMAVFSDTQNDTEVLMSLVEKKDYIFIRDRPAINHLIYNDYRYRKTYNLESELVQCPFVSAKKPFLYRKRAFAYPPNSKWSILFDPE